MKSLWVQGLDNEKAVDVKQNFKESAVMRRRFFEIALEIIENSRKAQVSKDAYSSPNWAYQQADRVGYERAIRDMIGLFSDS